MSKKAWLALLLVIFLSAFLRFYKLASVPPSLDWDEAAIGWNAKTIFHTRRDEFGTRLPLSFRSFGDYKAPVYIYLTTPIVGVLGRNEISVRLISVIAGIASVALIYLLTLILLEKSKLFSGRQKRLMALLAALLLALSPWHVLLSRPAFEPNLALFFILLGTWLFLLGVKKKSFLLIPSALIFVLSLYTYHSPKIFVPVFLLGLAVIYRKKLMARKVLPWVGASAILGIIALVPLVNEMLFLEGSSRFQGTSIFYTRKGEKKPINLELISQLGNNYLIHYSPGFLFLGDDQNPRVQMRNVGPLLLIQAPFLIIGLIYLVKKRKEKWVQFLLWWFLIGPIAAVVGFEIPHPIRAFNILPALVIISALGLVKSFEYIKGKQKRKTVSVLLGLLFLINSAYFLYRYFFNYPIYAAPDWQYGHKQAAEIARKYEDQVNKIIMTSAYGQPHIFMFFYQDRDPQNVFWGAMAKYLYRDLKWDEDSHKDNVLLIGTPKEIPENAEGIIDEIKFPDKSTAFRVVRTKQSQ